MNLKRLINTARTVEIPSAERHAAFGQLVRHFQAMVYATAAGILDDKQLAEEAVQEAFITAYQQLPQLREPDAFPGWIKQIGRNAALRLVRGKGLPTDSLDNAHDIPTAEADPALKAEVSDLREQILTAVEALPEPERRVVELFYIQGYSQREDFGLQLLQMRISRLQLLFGHGKLLLYQLHLAQLLA